MTASAVAAWTAADIPDQTGRTIVVTGANSGLGLAAARAVAEAGAHVVLAVRDTARGTEAAETLPGSTEVRRLDLADLASVREFAATLGGPVDVLLNNAGIMGVPRGRSADGFERQIATNHLGHFALTNLLLPRIRDRVVTMSSLMHKSGHLDTTDLSWEHRRYRRWHAYSASKLANLLFAAELQRRLAAVDSPVRSLAAHPGWAATNLQSRSGSRIEDALMGIGNRLFAQTGDMGAEPTLFAATADVPGNSYVGPDGRFEMRGHPTLVSRSTAATDEETARKLWILSENLTGTSFGGAVPVVYGR
jgi:NAD(P)-dependent dehydrogenase (short-subunit alcohol dehydrogenase family)